MVRSMTGFGRKTLETGEAAIGVEIKTVNQRFLKIQRRVSDVLSPWTPQIDKLVKKYFARGVVNLTISYQPIIDRPSLVINRAALRHAYEEVSAVARDLGVSEAVRLGELLGLPGVATEFEATSEEDGSDLWQPTRTVLEQALQQAAASRQAEGEAIQRELASRLDRLEKLVASVEEQSGGDVERYRDRLLARVQELLSGAEVEVGRDELLREVTLYAERVDISEELQRLKTHFTGVRQALTQTDPVGRRLEFLGQEMLREANTMASKAQDSRIVQTILEIKLEIDKIREQALNVE